MTSWACQGGHQEVFLLCSERTRAGAGWRIRCDLFLNLGGVLGRWNLGERIYGLQGPRADQRWGTPPRSPIGTLADQSDGVVFPLD